MTKTIEFKTFNIDLINEWNELIGKYNWKEFHFCKLKVEKEYMHGSFEIEAYILGFGLRIYWTWNREMLEAKAEEYNKILKESKFITLEEFEKEMDEEEEK